MNLILLSSRILANSAFSDKNPYPGCTASELVNSIEETYGLYVETVKFEEAK